MAAEFHSDVGPSSLERVLACTASVKVTADMESETSEFAEEGTAAHAEAESGAFHRTDVHIAGGHLATKGVASDRIDEYLARGHLHCGVIRGQCGRPQGA